ncbi:MAG: hypothetical protein ACYDDF_07640 [Thermoplasmatota archaeon]
MATTIPLSSGTRERLRHYGHAGMTYDEILVAMMDRLDERDFVADLRRRAARVRKWVDLEALE